MDFRIQTLCIIIENTSFCCFFFNEVIISHSFNAKQEIDELNPLSWAPTQILLVENDASCEIQVNKVLIHGFDGWMGV